MKSIVIFPNTARDINNEVTERTVQTLTGAGHKVYASLAYRKKLSGIAGLSFKNEHEILENVDLGIVLGGDGSILKAAGECAPFGVPILGINLGHVGYMAGVESRDIEKLVTLVDSQYKIESRMMLDISIMRSSKVIFSGGPVLNDVVLTKSKGYGVIEASISCDGEKLNTFRGDGLITTTPTGSTAYSLSAGGPIIDPMLDCICITPICAHSLKSRPVVFKDSSLIEISCKAYNNSACVTLDGTIAFDIEDNDQIHIKKSSCRAKIVKTDESGFCATLYKKIADKQ